LSDKEESLASLGSPPSIHPSAPPENDGDKPFWHRLSLEEMSADQWESLCDGCGRCCLNKLEDEDTGMIEWTAISCRLLDDQTCRCTNYADRAAEVPECVRLTPEKARTLGWLPPTCGYRLVAEGRDLYWWHPLVSGDPDTVHQAGISVRGRVISETAVPLAFWEEFAVDWPRLDPEERSSVGDADRATRRRR
jgi:uncharacterized protein